MEQKIEAVYSSGSLVPTYQTTRCHNSEDYDMNHNWPENLEFYSSTTSGTQRIWGDIYFCLKMECD
jgi:hypothetical protein